VPTAAGDTPAELDRLYRKVSLRLLPLLGLCYLAAYLDRVNVGFAKLQMARDLELSNAAYGFGAGIFFIGYFLFEVPSNLILHRVGARAWLARIMASWALISAASALLAPVRTAFGSDVAAYVFYAIRFLLGAAEAGFFPGVLLYLTCWFPASRRSLAVGRFLIAQPIAFVAGAPLSGLILDRCDGIAGMRSWQWMYLLEALPAAFLGIVLLLRLDNRIDQASWLSPRERARLSAALEEDSAGSLSPDLPRLARDPAIWRLASAYFLLVLGAYGLNFWLPSIVKMAGVSTDLSVGLLTACPYAAGVIVMLFVAGRTPGLDEARARAAWMCGLAGMGLAISAFFSSHLVVMMLGMSLGVTGYLTANALFWRLPSEAISGRALAAALAAVNALGNLGGFVGPYLMGLLVGRSSDPRGALLALALSLVVAGGVLVAGRTPTTVLSPLPADRSRKPGSRARGRW
jgi:MFS family permease